MSASLIAPVNAHLNHLDHLDHSGSRSGSRTTHGHQSNDPARPRMTLPSSASSTSSYSILSPPRSVTDVSSPPHLGSSHSESEPHFPGAWVDTAPGTPAPAPLKDDRDNFAEQMKDTNLTERDVLPRSSTSTKDMTQVSSGLTKTKSTDPSLLPLPLPLSASRDDETEVAGPIKRLAENPQMEYDEPPSATKINPVSATSIVNTAPDSLNPSAPAPPPRASVDQASSNHAKEVQDNSHPLEQVMGSTLSPDKDVQEGARLAGQDVPDSFVVPVVPIIATLGQHEHPTNANPQPIHPTSSNTTTQPNNVHPYPDVERSSRNLTSATQKNVKGPTNVVPVNGGRQKGASTTLFTTQAPSPTPSKSTPSPDRTTPNSSSFPHSAYPEPSPSEGDSLDQLSTRAVGGDTSVTSLSTSVGNGDSENNSSRKGVTGIEHAPRPIFSEEHGRALGTQHGRDAALTADAIAGDATTAAVAAKEGDEKEATRFQHSASPGTTKSRRFSGTRKLHKSTGHSLSGGKFEETSAGRAPTDLPTGAAFPQSTYVVEDGVGAPQDLSKDPLLAPLPVDRGGSGIVEPTTKVGSPEHKHHKLTKKHSPTAGAPPRVPDSPIRPSTETLGTSTGLRSEVETKGAHAYRDASETGHHTRGNEYTPKPKLMDRIKGEVKIMQGTLKGDEGKKMEGRMLKEFGSF